MPPHPLISASIIGKNAGLMTLGAGMTVMSVMGILSLTGAIQWDFDVWKHLTSASSWIDQIIGVGIIIAAVILTISRIRSFLDSLAMALEKRNLELSHAYAALEEETRKLTMAEEIRKQHEARFNAVVDYMPFVAIQTFDRDGSIISWNRAPEGPFGIGTDEAIGKTWSGLSCPGTRRPFSTAPSRHWTRPTGPANRGSGAIPEKTEQRKSCYRKLFPSPEWAAARNTRAWISTLRNASMPKRKSSLRSGKKRFY
ncbi:MAG TPA: PAS domain S-box protein [Spirochaetota bacterium]|nr:PAS domain S-box protein [Spirochaetota bacterium]